MMKRLFVAVMWLLAISTAAPSQSQTMINARGVSVDGVRLDTALNATRAVADKALTGPAYEIAPEQICTWTTDAAPCIQQADDAAEAQGKQLRLTAGVTYPVHSTLYLGSVPIRSKGATLAVLIDDTFVQRGTGFIRNEGVIITKAAPGAGYGVTTVALDIDDLNVVATRTSISNTPKASILLQNVSSLTANRISSTISTAGAARADTTGLIETVPLDFRDGVQNVNVATIQIGLDNPVGLGGFWIRSRTETRDTENVYIGSIIASTNTRDEPVAIFNSGTPATDVHDVRIGYINFRNNGGAGLGPSITRIVGDYDATKMQRISIDRIEGVIGAIGYQLASSGGFGVKVQKSYATIGSIKLTYNGPWDARQATIFGVRFAPSVGQTDPLFIQSIEINADYANAVPSSSSAMLYGNISTGTLRVRGAGSGFRQVAYGVADLRGVDVKSTAYAEVFAYGARSVEGAIDGPMRDVGPFRGSISIDSARWAGQLIYRPTTVGLTSGAYSSVALDADVNITGAGGIARIAAIEPNTTVPLPADIRYRLNNPLGATVGADSIPGNAALTRYDALRSTATSIERISWPTLVLSNHAITVYTDHHSIDTEAAAATDTLTTIAPGKDGQTVVLKGISSTKQVSVLQIGNIITAGDFAFVTRRDQLTLKYDADTATWNEVARASANPLNVLASGSVLTIDANGAIAVAKSLHRISATGTIKTITGGYYEGQQLRLFPASGTTLTIQNGGGGNTRTSTGANIVATNPNWVDLWWSSVSGVWYAKP